jgi:hypothetical protein
MFDSSINRRENIADVGGRHISCELITCLKTI